MYTPIHSFHLTNFLVTEKSISLSTNSKPYLLAISVREIISSLKIFSFRVDLYHTEFATGFYFYRPKISCYKELQFCSAILDKFWNKRSNLSKCSITDSRLMKLTFLSNFKLYKSFCDHTICFL